MADEKDVSIEEMLQQLQQLKDETPTKGSHRITAENARNMQKGGQLSRIMNKLSDAKIVDPDPKKLAAAKTPQEVAKVWLEANFESFMRRMFQRALVNDQVLIAMLRCLIRDTEEEERKRNQPKIVIEFKRYGGAEEITATAKTIEPDYTELKEPDRPAIPFQETANTASQG